MQAQGEETDGLITTQSKLRQKILDATKVKSNDYRGVDILDENGNYLSTYQTLLKISQVFKEIQEEDKKFGTNRGSFLAETLGGKTRAAAVTSILSDPQLLEDVYNASLDSEGSAQKELDKQLESIEGRIQRLQNHLQELAAISINSDWLKTMISLLDSGVGLVISLTKNLKSANVVIGLIAGTLTTLSGKTFFDAQSFKSGKIPQFIQGLMKIRELGGVMQHSLVMDDQMVKLGELDSNVFSARQVIEKNFESLPKFFDGLSAESKQAIEPLWERIEDGSAKVNDIIRKDADGSFHFVNQQALASQTTLEKLGSGFKSFGMGLFNGIVNTLIATGISFIVSTVVSKAIEGIDNILHHAEKVKEAGVKAKESIDEIYSGLDKSQKNIVDISQALGVDNVNSKTAKQNLDEIAEKYIELKNGVNGLTNANKSLTTEKYQQYLDLCNDLAEQFPALARGYDDQGNAILGLGNNVDTCRERLDSMYQSMLNISSVELTGNLQKFFAGLQQEAKEATDKLAELEDERSQLKHDSDMTRWGYRNPKAQGSDALMSVDFYSNEQYQQWLDSLRENYRQQLEDAIRGGEVIDKSINGIDLSQLNKYNVDNFDLVEQYVDNVVAQISSIPKNMIAAESGEEFMIEIPIGFELFPDFDSLRKSVDGLANDFQYEELERMGSRLLEMSQDTTEYQNVLKEVNKKYQDTLGEYVKSNYTFQSLPKDVQNAFLTNISQWEYDDVQGDSLEKYWDDFFLGTFRKIDESAINVINEAVNDDTLGDTVASEFYEGIFNKLKEATGDENLAEQLMNFYGFTSQQAEYDQMKATLLKQLEGIGLTQEDVDAMTIGQLEKGLSLTSKKQYVVLKDFFNELYATFVEVRDGTLENILKSQDFQDQSKVYTDAISAISTAMEALKSSGGELVGEAATTLREALPSIDFGSTIDSDKLVTEGQKQVKGWLSLIYDQADFEQLSKEGMQQLLAYVTDTVFQFRDIMGAEGEDVAWTFAKNFVETLDKSAGVAQTSKAAMDALEGFKENFKEELGSDEDNKILFMLSFDTEFLNADPETQLKMFQDAKYHWGIQLDLTEFEAQMALVESRLKELEARNSALVSEAERKVRNGEYDTSDEIIGQIRNNLSSVNELREKRAGMFDKNNKESFWYRVREGDLKGAKPDAIEAAYHEARTAVMELDEQILKLGDDNQKLSEDLILMPITTLEGQETMDNLKGEYDKIVADLAKYGEQTELPADMFSNFMEQAQQIVTNQNYKIDFFDAILNDDSDKYLPEFKIKVQELRDTAQDLLDSTIEDINTYSDRSGYGNIIAQISGLKGQKDLFTTLQSNSGNDMTKEDYEMLDGFNKAINEAYTEAIAEVQKEWQDIEGLDGVNLSNLNADERKHYDELVAYWKQLVGEQAEIVKEMNENAESAKLIDVNEMEYQTNQFHQAVERLRENIGQQESNGDKKVNKGQYRLLYEQMLEDERNQLRLAARYDALAEATPTGQISKRREYEANAQTAREAAKSVREQRSGYRDKFEDYDVTELEFETEQLEQEATRLQEALENALRPLKADDYTPLLDNIEERLGNLSEEQAHWEQRMKGVEKWSPKWIEYNGKLQTVLGSIQSLTEAQRQYNQEVANLEFDEINRRIESTNSAMARNQKNDELDIAKGGYVSYDSYELTKSQEKELIEDNQEGINKSMRKIRELIGGDMWRLVSTDVINQALSKDFDSPIFDGVDTKLLETAVDAYNNFYNGRIDAEIQLTNTQKEQMEQRSVNLEKDLAGLQAVTTGIEQANNAITESGYQLTDSGYDNLIKSYEDQIPVLKQLELEYTALSQAYPEDDKYVTSLNNITSMIDEISQKEITLRTEQSSRNLTKLATQMTDLSNEYSRLESTIGQTTDDESVYGQMINVANAQYLNKMAEASDKDSLASMYMMLDPKGYMGNEFYNQYRQEAESARQEAQQYVDTIKELKNAIDALPENRIAATQGVLEAKSAVERSKISYKSGVNPNSVTSEDYDILIKTDEANARQQEQLVDILAENRRKATEDYTAALSHYGSIDLIPQEVLDAYTKANSEFYSAESELFSKQEQVAKDYQEANQALLSAYNEATRLTNLQKGALDNQKAIDDAMGKIRGRAEIEADISINQQSLSEAMEALNNLDISDFKGVGETEAERQADQKRQFDEMKAQLEAAATEAQVELINLGKEEDMVPINNIQRLLQAYDDEWQDLQEHKDAVERVGNDLSEKETDAMLTNIDNRRHWLEKVQDLYEGLYEANKGTSVGDSMKEGIQQTKAALASLDEEEYQIKYNIDMKPLNDLQEEMGYLERDTKEFNEALNNPKNSSMSQAEALNGLIENNKEQIKNLAKQANEYREHMKKIEEANPEGYLLNDEYIKAAEGLSNTNEGIKQLNASTREYFDTLNNLPADAVNRMIAYLNALNGLESAKNDLKVANGGLLNADDFAGIIANTDELEKQAEEAYNLAHQDTSKAYADLLASKSARPGSQVMDVETASAAYTEALTAETEAQADLLRAQIASMEARKQAYEAGTQQYQQRQDFLNNYASLLESERELEEARGFDTRTEEAIDVDIQISGESRKAMQDELDALVNDPEHGGLNALEFAQKRVELEKAIAGEDTKILNLNKELLELPLKTPERALEIIRETGKELDRQKQKYEQLGQAIPDELFQDLRNNAKSERTRLQNQSDIYAGLIEEAESSGWFGRLFTKGWKEAKAEIDDQIANLDIELVNLDNEEINQDLAEIGYAMDELQDKGQKLQKALESSMTVRTEDSYLEAIENANAQMKNLMQQRKEIQDQIDAGPEEGESWDENDSKYQELLGQLRSIDNEYESLGESVRGWYRDMRNLNIVSITNELEKYEAELERIENRYNNLQDLGYRMTTSDYELLGQMYTNEADIRQREYLAKSARLQEVPMMGVTIEGVRIGSDDYKQIEAEANTAYLAWQNALQKAAQNDRTIELLPVQEYERQVGKLQEEFDRIQADADASTFGISTSQLERQSEILDEQRNQLQSWKNFLDQEFLKYDGGDYQDFADDIHAQALEVQNDIDALNQNQITIKANIEAKPFNNLENQYSQLESDAQELSNKLGNLGDPFGKAAESIMQNQVSNAKQRMSIITQQMNEYQAELLRMEKEAQETGREVTDNTSVKFGNKTYTELNTTLQGLRNTYRDLRKEVDDTNKSIRDIRIENLNKLLENLGADEALISAEQNLKVAVGAILQPEDWQATVDNAAAQLEVKADLKLEAEDALEEAEQNTFNALNDLTANALNPFANTGNRLSLNLDNTELADEIVAEGEKLVEEQRVATNNLKTASAEELTALQEYLEAGLSQVSSSYESYGQLVNAESNKLSTLQNEISKAEQDSLVATDAQYENVIRSSQEYGNSLDTLLTKQQNARTELETLFATARTQYPNLIPAIDVLENNLYIELDEQIQSTIDKQTELTEATIEYRRMLAGGAEQKLLADQLAKIQAEAGVINETISNMEAMGQKSSVLLQSSLVGNYSDQINNLNAQNDALIRMQSVSGTTKAKFDELQQSIDANSSAIGGLIVDIYQATENLKHFASNAASELSTVVSQAMSESLSGGVSNETVTALTAQFSDLAKAVGVDVNNAFYASSNGIKVNTNALKNLLKIQKAVYSGSVLKAINNQRNAIKKLLVAINDEGRYQRNTDKHALEGARAKLRAMNKELAGYKVLADALDEMTSRYQKWQEAEQTPNPGDKLEAYANAAPDYEEMRRKGKVGTDEFKAYTALWNYWGDSSMAAYDQQYENMLKYLYPEGGDMVTAFMNGLVENGYAHKDEFGRFVTELFDIEDVARTMGMSTEMVRMFLGEAKDYGFVITDVKDQADGLLQEQEKELELIDQLRILSKKEVLGATDAELSRTVEELQKLDIEIDNIQEAIALIGENPPLFDEEDYDVQLNLMSKLIERANLAYDMGEMNIYDVLLQAIEDISKEYGIFVEGLEDGNTHLTLSLDNTYNTALDRANAFKAEMESYLPDLSKITDPDVDITNYKNALQELKDLSESMGLGIDFDLDPAKESVEEIKEHMNQLSKLSLGELSPAAQQTIDNLMAMDATEIKFQLTIESLKNQGMDIDAVELAKIATEDNQKAIDLVMNATTGVTEEDAQAIVDLAKSKALDVPMKVEFDESSIDNFIKRTAEAFNIEISPVFYMSEEQKQKLLQEMTDEVVQVTLTPDTSALAKAYAEAQNTKPYVTIEGDTTVMKKNAATASKEVEEENKPIVFVSGDTNPLMNAVKDAKQLIESNPMTASITANTVTLFNSIQEFLNKNTFSANVSTNVSTTGIATTTSPIATGLSKLSLLSSKAHGTISAYAHGKGTIEQDEDAVVNEVLYHGQREGLIRDGVLTEIPGGMHVEHLKKGDVILNSKQMAQLMSTGKASGQAKIQGGIEALAHGTLDGMSAYATGGYGGAFGAVYTDPTKTKFGERFGTIDDNVDSLDDFKDATDDAADGLEDMVNHQIQSIDLIQRAINTFATKTQKIADKITEYVDNATKRSLLGQEAGAILDQISVNSLAALRYNAEAIKEAYNHKWYDDKGNEMYSSATEAFGLDTLRSGAIDIISMETGDQYSQAIYESAQQFMDLTDKAISANDAIAGLVDQLTQVYVQINDLPFEELEKSVSKLESSMSSLEAFMSASESGGTGIYQLTKILHEIMPGDVSDMIPRTLGKTYEYLNEQSAKNLELKRKEVEENRKALLSSQQSVRTHEGNLTEAEYQLGIAKSSLYGLDVEDQWAVASNQVIDASKYTENADSIANYNRWAAQFQALSNALQDANKKVAEQFEKTKQIAAEYAKQIVDTEIQALERINNYYEAFVQRQDGIISRLEGNNDIIRKWIGFETDNFAIDTQVLAQNLADASGDAFNTATNILKNMNNLGFEDSTSLQTQFGNIDLANRQAMKWNKKNRKRYKEIFSMDVDPKTASNTLITTINDLATDVNGNYVEAGLLFSPYLQTDSGKPILLDSQTISEYTRELLNRSITYVNQNGQTISKIDTELLLQLDANPEGIGMKYGDNFIHGLIAAVQNGYIQSGDYIDSTFNKIQFADQNMDTFNDAIKQIEQTAKELGMTMDEAYEYLLQRANGQVNSASTAMMDNYANIISRQAYQLEITRMNIEEQQKRLNSGELVKGTQEWFNAVNRIDELQNKEQQLMTDQFQTFDDMINLPADKLEENLNHIANAFSNLNSVLDNGISNSRAMSRTLNQINKLTRGAFGDIGQIDLDENNETYVNTNRLIAEQAKETNANISATIQSMIEYKQIYDSIMADPNASAAQRHTAELKWTEIKNNGLDTINKGLAENNNRGDQMMQEVENYYASYASFFSTAEKRLATQRENIKNNFGYEDGAQELIENYGESAELTSGRIATLSSQAQAMRSQLDQFVKDGIWDENDENYRNWAEKIMNVEDEIDSLIGSQKELFTEMLNMPGQILQEKLADLEKEYSALNIAMNANILTTSAEQRAYATLSQVLYDGFKQADSIARLQANLSNVQAQRQAEEQRKADYKANLTKGASDANSIVDSAYRKALGYYTNVSNNFASSIGAIVNSTGQTFTTSFQEVSETVKDNTKSNENLKNATQQSVKINRQLVAIEEEWGDAVTPESENGFDVNVVTDGIEESWGKGFIVTPEIEAIIDQLEPVPQIFEDIAAQADEMYAAFDPDNMFTDIMDIVGDYASELAADDYYTNMQNNNNMQNLKHLGGFPYTNYISSPSFIGANKSVIDALQQQIAETGLKSQAALAAREMYNVVSNDTNSTKQQIKEAKEAADAAQKEAQEAIAELAKQEANAILTMVNNIQNWFSMVNNFYGQISSNAKAIRDYVTSTFGYMDNISTITDTYTTNITKSQEQMRMLQAELQTVNDQLTQAVISGEIYPDDDQFIQVVNTMEQLQGQIISTVGSLQEFYKGLYDIPNQVATQKIDQITKRFQTLTSAISNGNLETMANQRMLANITQNFGTNFVNDPEQYTEALNEQLIQMYEKLEAMAAEEDGFDAVDIQVPITLTAEGVEEAWDDTVTYVENTVYGTKNKVSTRAKDLFSFDMGETFVGQNAALQIDLERERQVFEAVSEALTEAQENFDKVRTSTTATDDEIRAAEEALNTATANYANEAPKYAKQVVETAKSMVNNIGNYYNKLISYNDSLISRIDKTREVMDALGRSMKSYGILATDTTKITELYESKVAGLENEQRLLAMSIAEQEAELEMVGEFIGKDTDDYLELQQALNDTKNRYDDVAISLNQTHDGFRTEYYLKPIDEAIERLEKLRSNFEFINGLIQDESKLTDEGEYTDMGKLSLSLDLGSYNTASDELTKAIEEYRKLEELYESEDNTGYYSYEDFLKDSESAMEKIRSAMSARESSSQAVITAIKNRYQTEINYIKELIAARQEELNKQKEIDQYERDMRNKNKSVQDIEAQIRALESLSSMGISP